MGTVTQVSGHIVQDEDCKAEARAIRAAAEECEDGSNSSVQDLGAEAVPTHVPSSSASSGRLGRVLLTQAHKLIRKLHMQRSGHDEGWPIRCPRHGQGRSVTVHLF